MRDDGSVSTERRGCQSNPTDQPHRHGPAPVVRAIGLMSGTSMDGIDAAVIETDGEALLTTGAHLTIPYDPAFRAELRACLGRHDRDAAAILAVERTLTLRHAEAVDALLRRASLQPAAVDLIGFHGQTLFHDPNHGLTVQIGDGDLLAHHTGIDVVDDFRSADVAAGGEGAPLAPLYHQALATALAKPLAVLNLGGVANVTWIGPDGTVIAGDTGPANALIDDWVLAATGQPFDNGGQLAASGRVEPQALRRLGDHPYFDRPLPKSLDRDAFNPAPVAALSPADGAATLSAFTAWTVARVVPLLPAPPARWLVCGGGRHNRTIMDMLRQRLQAPLDPVESVGWNGDALEAQAFAYLAVRSRRQLPLSVPGTTGVARPISGGRFHPRTTTVVRANTAPQS